MIRTPSRAARLAALLALSLSAACASGGTAAGAGGSSAATAPAKERKLVIVAVNDTHGQLLSIPTPKWLSKVTNADVGGADWFAGWVNAIRADAAARGNEVLLLDGGDLFQGTLISNQFQGRSVVDVYNQVGMDAAAIGNHEFDWGIDALKANMARSKFPILSANVFYKGTRTRPDWAKPTAIFERLGAKIGVIGLSTKETPLTTNAVNIADLEFPEAGPIAAQLADELRAQGCTVVIITAHCGPKGDNEIQHIAEHVKGKVNAIVSGHHHEPIGPPPLIVANIPIVQMGSKLNAFSIIELGLDEKGAVKTYSVNEGAYPKPGGPQPILHTADGLPVQYRGRTIAPDGPVAAILRDYDVQVKQLREQKIGRTEVMLAKGGKDDLLTSLCSDALRSGAGGSIKADFAFQNGGGIRIPEIGAGDITFGQIFDLYPFDNQQIVLQMPANQVRNALEAVLRAGKGPLRASGLRYTIDWNKFGAGKNLKAAPPGAIVTEIINTDTGKPLCVTKSCSATECTSECATGTFTLSVTDFLANGGDGLTMLKDAPRQVGNLLARDIIVAFVKEHQPLTPQLLGAQSVGTPPRITTVGQSKSQLEQQ